MTAEQLKAVRMRAEMTQDQLADAIGMSRKSIGEMERGVAQIERRTELAVLYATTDRTEILATCREIERAAAHVETCRSFVERLGFDQADVTTARDLLMKEANFLRQQGHTD